MKTATIIIAVCTAILVRTGRAQETEVPDVARLRPDLRTGFSNGGWNYDRYTELERLNAGKRMLAADLEGPGIIRSIHTTRHHPSNLMARGIVLEIWFDDAERPAVHCPLADFFGDGCNGSAMDFTSNLIECAPWSYNCYIPMPFQKRARIYLRNDTERDAMNYCYVEWEPLKNWDESYGYFHATYRRDLFQLTKETNHTFLELRGTGHILGRQFSVVTNEPFFDEYGFVMEGNNEVDIDGRERAVDYLGTEDSFSFSWGFRSTFAGQRAGMTLVDVENPSLQRLSIYRFHDYMPIRFRESLTWKINWTHETFFVTNPVWPELVARGGCGVDYATVHYWYQDSPGGYDHAPLRPVPERIKQSLCPDRATPRLLETFQTMTADANLVNTFDTRVDIERVRVLDCYEGTHPLWIDQPAATGGHPGNPNPGRSGILGLHALSRIDACYALRKVVIPDEEGPFLALSVSGDPYEIPGGSDFLLQAGVIADEKIEWFDPMVVGSGSTPSEQNWKDLKYPLDAYRGKEVGLVVKIAGGGRLSKWINEEAFLDEFSVGTR
jgi:hypothetical protein